MRPKLEAHRDLTPEACASLIIALENAETRFREWKVRISAQAGLQDAKRWLSRLANRKSLDLSLSELQKTSDSAALAVDLYHISAALGNEPVRQIAAELEHLAVSPLGTAGSPQDYRSQFWVGTMLAQSGLEPRIETVQKKSVSRPDFVVRWATLDFAVEVKCPKSIPGALRALRTAASQLQQRPEPGVIAIDASYAFGFNPTKITQGEPPLRDQVRSAQHELHTLLVRDAEQYRQSAKFARLAVLFTFARFWSWHVQRSVERDAGIIFSSTIFPEACQGLIARQADGLQNALLTGIEQLTGNPPIIAKA